MDLARFQSSVARLLVDAELRRRFLADPASASAALEISESEAEALLARVEGLAPFADSLIRKRLGAVRGLLPRAAELIGSPFDEAFRRYAGSHSSKGPRRHERDALALAVILKPGLSGEALEALTIEAGWIEAASGRTLLIRRLPSGSALWLRAGRKVRFWRVGGSRDWTRPAPAAQESEESP